MWLDVLPDDVCVQIAAHISRGEKNVKLETLACASEKQRRAVVSCLGKKYVEPFGESSNSTWKKIFKNSGVVELDLEALDLSDDDDIPEDIISLLNEPTLRKVTITDRPKLLKAVQGTSISDMTVAMENSNAPQLLLDTLQTLNLHTLALHCASSSSEVCCIGREDQLTPEDIGERCPELACIEIECYCDMSVSHDFNALFASRIPSLRHVTIHTQPSKHVAARLATFDSVRVNIPFSNNPIDGFLIANQFPTVVTELVLGWTWLNAEQVRAIAQYPNLKRLKCGLFGGAEVALVDVCRAAPSLHTLQLDWNHESGGKRGPYNDFKIVSRGALLRLVESAPSLANLSLCHVKIPAAELHALLRYIGSRLESLEISAVFESEDDIEKLVTILETLVVYNSNVQSIRLENTNKCDEHAFPPGAAVQAGNLLSRLRCRNPCLRVTSLHYPYTAKNAACAMRVDNGST